MTKKITLGDIVDREQHQLDLFNLELAEYRVINGVTDIIPLYRSMGKLSNKLMEIQLQVDSIERLQENIACDFDLIKEE